MKNPWHRVSALAFLKEVATQDSENREVVLTVKYRHDVASRYWWTLEWTAEDGARRSVSAQTFDLLFERAAEAELQVREREDEKTKAEMEEGLKG